MASKIIGGIEGVEMLAALIGEDPNIVKSINIYAAVDNAVEVTVVKLGTEAMKDRAENLNKKVTIEVKGWAGVRDLLDEDKIRKMVRDAVAKAMKGLL